jgi:uncharacterized protein YegL
VADNRLVSGRDNRLGGTVSRRPLHFFWLLDRSGSMHGEKMQALNIAVREAIPHLQDAARANPSVQLMVRALGFSTSVSWLVGEPTPIERFTWTDLTAEPGGRTELGLAFAEVTGQIRVLEEEHRGFAPALVLVSDGRPTDTVEPSFGRALRDLMSTAWGSKSVRMAIGIGRDADLDSLKRFIGHSEIDPVRADNPDQLVSYLRWASTVAIGASSVARSSRLHEPPPNPSDESLVWGPTIL